MPFLFSNGIICGPHWRSFAVRDHLQSNLKIISGLAIICSRGSFAALYSLRPTEQIVPTLQLMASRQFVFMYRKCLVI